MLTQPQIDVAIEQVMGIMDRFQGAAHTGRSLELMRFELLALFLQFGDWPCDNAALEERLIRPLDEEIVRRHGHENGLRLLHEFVRVFSLARVAVPTCPTCGQEIPSEGTKDSH